jgi:hypothetical protein
MDLSGLEMHKKHYHFISGDDLFTLCPDKFTYTVRGFCDRGKMQVAATLEGVREMVLI